MPIMRRKVNLICCEVQSSDFILKLTEFYFSMLASWALCFRLIYFKKFYTISLWDGKPFFT